MRWSEVFIPTLREDPAGAEVASHGLMLRAGLVRQLAAGIYSLLPLGLRVLRRIEGIVREEMERIGAQEFALPALQPAEPWKRSGRWETLGPEMFRLRDRRQAEMCLGMTHEEIFTLIARDELRSYRQLPQTWYQIQAKFRDEPRPKSGVLRARQFTMKDSYSFDLDEAGLARSFERHMQAYRCIFARCGVESIAVEASSGAMGGSESVEFMAVTDAGEDWIVTCACGYAANLEKARSTPEAPACADPDDSALPERFPTPGVRTIEELAAFPGGAPADRQIKTLVYVVSGDPVLLLLRGDDELNEVKLLAVTGSTDVRPAHPEEMRDVLGASAGSLGAVGVGHLPVWVDETLRGRRGMTTGANQDGFHLRHVDVGRDLAAPRFADLRNVREGEACMACGQPLRVRRSIELGHVFKLGGRYSEPLGASVLTAQGREVPLMMGSYGIGLERLMAAVVEAHHDADGIRWPPALAPFAVLLVPVRVGDAASAQAAERLYAELSAAGIAVLLDDRDERPGVKFKDADLIGVPWRVVLGPRALARGRAELVARATRESEEIPLDGLTAELARRTTT